MAPKGKAPCIECGTRPKWLAKHRCRPCAIRHDSITVRVDESRRRLAMVPDALRKKTVPAALWPPGTRWCAGCQSFVDLEDVAAGLARCRACVSAKSHAAMVEKTYGIGGSEYERLFALQGGRCAICRNRPKKTRLAVDHDHKTGAVRGLCCKNCNHDLLGSARDSLALLNAAVRYLDTPPASGHWSPPETSAAPSAPATPDGFLDPGAASGRPAAAVSGDAPKCSAYHYLPSGSKRDASGNFFRVYVGDDQPAPF